MKRGFLNSKKVRKEALYPIESGAGAISTRVSASASSGTKAVETDRQPTAPGRIKLPDGNFEFTVLPANSSPSKLVRVESEDVLVIATIPHIIVGGPPDPEGHSEWIVNSPTMKKVLNAPGYPQPVPRHPGSKSYQMKSTPTMGKGLFAIRDIPRGEIIFAERPLLVTSCMLTATTTLDPKDHGMADYMKIMLIEKEQQLEVAVERLEPERRNKLMALANSHLDDGSGPIWGIVRTNGYWVGNLWDGDVLDERTAYYNAVCDIGSRINHSCLPNICHVFKLSSFSMLFMAARDIKSGEQLFYSYCGRDTSVAQRKEALAPYGIGQCICASCVNATAETDTIRLTFFARVEEYKQQKMIWERLPLGQNLPVGTLDELLDFKKAAVKEGLDTNHNYWLDFMPALATAYGRVGRYSEAVAVLQEILRWREFAWDIQELERA